MLKQKTYTIEGSNIAGLGTELEKKVRQAAGGAEPQWKTAGKAVGLEIWRVEQFKIKPVDKKDYGSFFTGDSYIILNTYKKEDSSGLAWDVHFWLGAHTTQDEAGTAAYKTVELDDFLGGLPVQHREVQDWESQLFLSYFPKGIKVMEGGIDSGFNHVEPKDYKPRLLQLKGKRNVRLREVPLKLDSVNSGDVFVLDLGLKLIQFNGSKSGAMEKAKGAEICRAIDVERGERPEVLVFEERDKDYPKEWVDVLGKGAIKSAEAGGSDLEFEKSHNKKVLVRVSDASGKLSATKVAEGKDVTPNKLDGTDVFIVDMGTEIFAWIGRGSSPEERKNGMTYAEAYLKKEGRPVNTPISRVIQGHESKYFFELFKH